MLISLSFIIIIIIWSYKELDESIEIKISNQSNIIVDMQLINYFENKQQQNEIDN